MAMRWRAQLSWRLPPRSRRWRWCLPELASSGANAGVAGELGIRSEASDRSDLAEQFGGRERGTTWEFEQLRSQRRGLHLELPVELADRAGQATAAAEQLAGDPDLRCLLAAAELSAEPLKPDAAVERAERDLLCRVELVQVPAQTLLSPSTLVDEIVAMVDQQLQLTRPQERGFQSPRHVPAVLQRPQAVPANPLSTRRPAR